MENSNWNGNLSIAAYGIKDFSAEEAVKIEAGEYPIILARDGVFTKKYITVDELNHYTNWDALDADVIAQRELHGSSVPIVWEANPEGGMYETGLEHKILSSPSEEVE
jgi:hypothetical protein